MEIKSIRTETENCHIKSVILELVNEETDTVSEIELLPTKQTGVFGCKDWRDNGLRDWIANRAFNMVLLSEPVEGDYNGFTIHIPNLIKLTAPVNHSALEELAKWICIGYQSTLTPALAYAKDFALDQYTPTKCEICKGCTIKRKCLFYKASGGVIA